MTTGEGVVVLYPGAVHVTGKSHFRQVALAVAGDAPASVRLGIHTAYSTTHVRVTIPMMALKPADNEIACWRMS